MSGKLRWIGTVLLCLLICPCLPARNAGAGTVDEADGGISSFAEGIQVRAWLEPAEAAAVTQQVRFIIELSTRTWFVHGTRLEDVELADAVVQQAGGFATNFTRRDKGLTWSVQQWTVFLYPLKEKTYRIPGIVVTASIADGKGHTLSGSVQTRPLAFRAVVPEPMRGRKNWIATTRLEVRERYSTQADRQEVGDAIGRTIVIEADGLPAMMLPIFPNKALPGLGVYEDPPRIIDDVNRGERVGRRIEHITYLIERRGAWRIPERLYSWFNLNTGQAEETRLPERWLATEGFEAPASPGKGALRDSSVPLRLLAPILGVGLFLFAGLMLLRRRKRRSLSGPRPSEAALRRALEKAVRTGQGEKALRILYQWLDQYGTPGGNCGSWRQFLGSRGARRELASFNRCMSALYGPDQAPKGLAGASLETCGGLLGRRSLARYHAAEKPGSGQQDSLCELPLF